ncbi:MULTISPECIES: hypothetical protein [unclassified Pseudoalteromonas]|uniref:hypothetical protein n=1 Tax=unclassified Pseudoalteromonas TaxID=194690 RepID=UPI0020980AA7|nr:hypothetical protein [Pseudoalteromonas sp. XMcav2-N]MCO7190288.1 hypothetical protein [Pseudoalteromonas sp. XMcav2-N]
MPYLIVLLLLLTSTWLPAQAQPAALHSAPNWFEPGTLQLHRNAADINLDAEQSRFILLPAGRWLSLQSEAQVIQMWQGQSPHAMQRITRAELHCEQNRCQLPAAGTTRLIRFYNPSEEIQQFSAWHGLFHRHRDPFRIPVKLALPAMQLYEAQTHTTHYRLNNRQSIQLFFAEATKLKLNARRILPDPAQPGIVSVRLNDAVISQITLSDSPAEEFAPQLRKHRFGHDVKLNNDQVIGLVSSDYIAVPAGGYLRLEAQGDTLLNLVRMERGLFDTDAAQTWPESLFNPYWTDNLQWQLEQVYQHHTISALHSADLAKTSALGRQRLSELQDTLGTVRFLQPKRAEHPFTTHVSEQTVTQAYRFATDRLYATQQRQLLHYHTLSGPVQFELIDQQRLSPTLRLYARTTTATQLIVEIDSYRHTIDLLPSGHFAMLELPLPLDAQQLSVTVSDPIEVDLALRVRELQSLPNNAVLYQRPGRLSDKSPAIAYRLEQQLQRLAHSYLQGLSRFVLTHSQHSTTKSSLSASHWHYRLGEAEMMVKQNPQQALPLLKSLIDSPHQEVVIRAWQLRLAAFSELGEHNTAERYLGALLSHPYPQLQHYAAQQLLNHYQSTRSIHSIQGLCSMWRKTLPACEEALRSSFVELQQNLYALWLGHDTRKDDDDLYPVRQQLGYTVPASHPPVVDYSLHHHGVSTLLSETSNTSAYPIVNQSLSLTAHRPMLLKVSARAQAVETQQGEIVWLRAHRSAHSDIMPIFNDVPSTTTLRIDEQDQPRLSIASTGYFSLQPGEQLTISSDQLLLLQFDALPPEHALTSGQDMKGTLWHDDFMSLLYRTPLSGAQSDALQRTLLLNALYRLERQTLSEHEYTALSARLMQSSPSPALDMLYNRIQSFGHWQAFEAYQNYAGTQLVDLSALSTRSAAEQFSRHTSRDDDLPGLILRPNHSLALDLRELQSLQVRLVLHFANAELLQQHQRPQLSVARADGNVHWRLDSNRSELGLTRADLASGGLVLRWLNPFAAQLLSVEVEAYQQGAWQTVDLGAEQLFYYGNDSNPITAKLNKDAVLKLEYVEQDTRREQSGFYPAGLLTLAPQTSSLARLYRWQLNPNRHKLAVAPALQPHRVPQPTLVYTPAKTHYREPVMQTDGNLTHVEGVMQYNRDGIYQSSEPLGSEHTLDLGIRLRNRHQQHWYRLESFFRLNNTSESSFSINGQYDWLDDEDDWFAKALWNNRWQESPQSRETHLTSQWAVTIGEIWREDQHWRHQWWWQPFYYYTSIEKDEYLADETISNAMFNFYRHNHSHGWRGGYRLRHQSRVDSQLSAQLTTTSNDDWTSLDVASLSGVWQQYYQGHIFSVGLSSGYVFADDHRPNATWQYLTTLGWQTLFDFSEHTGGWISLNWTQDWFRNNHSIRFEVTLGNLQRSGFDPFAHDEIIFESLQLTHFLEQDLYGR